MIKGGESLEPVLRAEGVYKAYGGSNFYALENVDFNVYPGKVNVLIGENGAGKSTLIKVFSGAHSLTKGQIYMQGKPITISSPIHANHLGIATVYQELSLAPELSVAENIFLGSDLITKMGMVSWKNLYSEAKRLMVEVLEMDNIDPRTKIKTLGIAHQQMIEIVRVMRRESKILILDEPTAVLTEKEIVKLFEIINRLKERGVSIIYISHRLEELFEIGDYITVFRDGKMVSELPVEQTNTDKLIEMMVGREITEQYPKEDFSGLEKKDVLRLENVCTPSKLEQVSFTGRTGEILGFAGLIGAGRTEIAKAIFGADKISGGAIYINGRKIHNRGIQGSIRGGVALVTEDRKGQGLNLIRSISENISMVKLKKLTGAFGVIKKQREISEAKQFVQDLQIVAEGVHSKTKSLSGGNQQKVVIAKWLSSEFDVIIFDEPTRGIDVGAKTEVYTIMNTLVKEGKVVIMISSDMMELLGMCDRIIAVKNGRLCGEFTVPVAQDELLHAMMEGS